jgi:2-polyprenyl-3-methyl-5-hydroxy-6-metoxy-1,4-benzoquinol methylase
MAERVGTDIASAAYWEDETKNYIDALHGPYHRHRLAMIEALCEGYDFHGSKCLDVGCGEGIFAKYLADRGAEVEGFDINDEMIRGAKAQFGTHPKMRYRIGGVECMQNYAENGFDFIFALNILAYLNPAEEKTFYCEAARILKSGGTLVITHSNELFDLYTLNRYTVDFFRKHFSKTQDQDVSELLTNPAKPTRTTFAVRENPLSYRFKLSAYGFEEKQQEFAHYHEQPPLLMPNRDPDDINSREYFDTLDWPEADRWKLMFMCSMFGSRSVLVR